MADHQKSSQEWVQKRNDLARNQRYEEALAVLDQMAEILFNREDVRDFSQHLTDLAHLSNESGEDDAQ